MRSYNNVTFVGQCVKDPDFKEVMDNSRANFIIAVDRPHKNEDGKHLTDFLNIVAWGKLAEIVKEYVGKRDLVLISGRIQSRSYEIEGETKWITEIIAESLNVLDKKGK